jgi:thiol-disulfide isomerase/thioredoxin
MACLLVACLSCENTAMAEEDALRTHALLINGGGTRRINFQSHLLHVKRIHGILVEAGVPANQISILSADGSDPEVDLATRDLQTEDRFWMLAGTRLEKPLRPRIKYVNSEIEGVGLLPATRANLDLWFEAAGNSLTPGDTLLLYVTDHGTLNKGDPSNNRITLWGKEETLSVDDLRELIDQLHPSVRVVALMSQCFSGSFAHLIFKPAGDGSPRANFGGFYSSTAGRPAYGCYPENRDKYNVGHSFRFFDALESHGSFTEAHEEVLLTDRTPDVPVRASDFYLESILGSRAESLDVDLDELVDRLLAEAWENAGAWEPEIRLLDRMGETFGYFSPRLLSELAHHTQTLSEVGKQFGNYETAWWNALSSLNRENLDRFLGHQPNWNEKLTDAALSKLSPDEKSELTRDLLSGLASYVETDSAALDRLELLRDRAESTARANYRAEVREAVVLRMRTLLVRVAGRQFLARDGSDAQRQAWNELVESETYNLMPGLRTEDVLAHVEPFPGFDEELEIAQRSLPGWVGIRFRTLSPERRKKFGLDVGAVSVLTVFPGSPAEQAGLDAGDIIIGPPGQPFNERDMVREWVMTAPIGKSQEIEVQRKDNRLTLSLAPDRFPLEIPTLPGPPRIGSPAPSLSQLEAYRGAAPGDITKAGPYLLFFWATWCGPCKAALPELTAFEREMNVPVLSITDEAAESVDAFLHKHRGPFPEAIALDEKRRSFHEYGVAGTPQFVLVDGQGNIENYRSGYRASQGLGFDDWEWQKDRHAP